MAENRAAFSLRRRRSLGFSKCRRVRATFKVPSRSTFFFSRRNARSTGSLFLSLISVKTLSHPLQGLLDSSGLDGRRSSLVRAFKVFFSCSLSIGKSARHHRTLNWRPYGAEQPGGTPFLHPGGQANCRPPSIWQCRWGTASPASGPLLNTSRNPDWARPSWRANSAALSNK